MITVEIAKPMGVMYFDACYPKTEYRSDEQKTTPEGVPLWSMGVLLRQPESKKSENITITVPCPHDPSQAIEPFTPIAFDGLRMMTGESSNGTWVSFAADKFGKPSK